MLHTELGHNEKLGRVYTISLTRHMTPAEAPPCQCHAPLSRRITRSLRRNTPIYSPFLLKNGVDVYTS